MTSIIDVSNKLRFISNETFKIAETYVKLHKIREDALEKLSGGTHDPDAIQQLKVANRLERRIYNTLQENYDFVLKELKECKSLAISELTKLKTILNSNDIVYFDTQRTLANRLIKVLVKFHSEMHIIESKLDLELAYISEHHHSSGSFKKYRSAIEEESRVYMRILEHLALVKNPPTSQIPKQFTKLVVSSFASGLFYISSFAAPNTSEIRDDDVSKAGFILASIAAAGYAVYNLYVIWKNFRSWEEEDIEKLAKEAKESLY